MSKLFCEFRQFHKFRKFRHFKMICETSFDSFTYDILRNPLVSADNLSRRRKLLYLWKEQGGICPVCNQPITQVTGWHNHHIVYKAMGGTDRAENRVLIHPNCHRQVHAKGLTVSKPRPVKAGPQAQPGALFHA